LMQGSRRFRPVPHGYLQAVLKRFEQVARHRHIMTRWLLTLDQLAPTDNEPLAFGNATLGFLQAITETIEVIGATRRACAVSPEARCHP